MTISIEFALLIALLAYVLGFCSHGLIDRAEVERRAEPGAYGDGAWRSDGDAWPRDRRGE